MKKQNEQKFSIRKYSVGIASVFVGSLLFGTGVAANTPTETFDPSLTDGLVQDGPVNEEVKDYTAVITVDGVEVARQTEFITLSDLKAKAKSLAAVEEANEALEFAGFAESDNTLVIKYVTKAVEAPKTDEAKEDFTIITVIDGVASTTEYTAITYNEFLEALAAINEANQDLKAGEVVYDGNKATLNFTTPVKVTSEWVEDEYVNSVNPTPNPEVTAEWTGDSYVELTEDTLEAFTLTVNVDGKLAQVSEYDAITHNDFLAAVGTVLEGFISEGATYSFEYQNSNHLVINVTAGVKSEWVEDEYVNSVNPTPNPEVTAEWTGDTYVEETNEVLENFVLTVNVDGKHQQTSSYEAIPYSKFLEAVGAIAEGLVAEGYAYDRLDWPSSNEAVLQFSTPVKAEWVEDEYVNSVNPTPNPEVKAEWVEDQYVNSVNTPATAPVATVSEVATKTEAKVATPAAAEAKTAEAKKLPETGTKETAALVSAGLMLIAASVGLSILKRRN